MSKEKQIKTSDWLIRGIPKEQLEREKQEAVEEATAELQKNDIEEMRKDLIEIFDEEYEKRRIITADFAAIKMTGKGYRKQSEGKWIFHKDGSGTCNQCRTNQLHIWDMDNFQSYCGHCGAKMKGASND